MKAQRLIHVTKGQEQVAEHVDKPSGHGKRINSKQAIDRHGSGACTRLRHHPLVPSQYSSGGSWVRDKRGYGLAVGRNRVPTQAFLGEMSYYDDILPKRRKGALESLGAYHRR